MATPADERHVPLTDDALVCPICLSTGEGTCSADGAHRVPPNEVERSFGDPFLGRTVLVRGMPHALLRVAGRGNQSRVFCARPLEGCGPEVAVKVVRLDAPDEGLEPTWVVANRLRRELEVAAALQGVAGVPEALGPVEAATPLPPFSAVAFEWIERSALPRPLAVAHVAAWARTLDAAHSRGLAHGDVAPDHLAWGPLCAHLLDWGCAVPLGAEVAAGRRAFASPELAASRRADAASDWFALGASVRAFGAPLTAELEVLVERLLGSPQRRLQAVAELVGRG